VSEKVEAESALRRQWRSVWADGSHGSTFDTNPALNSQLMALHSDGVLRFETRLVTEWEPAHPDTPESSREPT
jgi:hypothetical protein